MNSYRALASQASSNLATSSSTTLQETVLPGILTNTLTHRQQQNRSAAQSVKGMPPLPQSVIEKIENGEFCKFWSSFAKSLPSTVGRVHIHGHWWGHSFSSISFKQSEEVKSN